MRSATDIDTLLPLPAEKVENENEQQPEKKNAMLIIQPELTMNFTQHFEVQNISNNKDKESIRTSSCISPVRSHHSRQSINRPSPNNHLRDTSVASQASQRSKKTRKPCQQWQM